MGEYPRRIQRQRAKGWRMPLGTVYVGRPSEWGNPYAIKPVDRHGQYPYGWRVIGDPSVAIRGYIHPTESSARDRAIELFRREIARDSWREKIVHLRGRDLACWCPLGEPCHADLLLVAANHADSGVSDA